MLGERLATWRRRHPRLAVGGLVLLAALLVGLCYRASLYLAARSHLRAAEQALARHDWSEAHTQLAACLRSWPDSPAAHLLAARAARRLGLPEEAEAHLDACQRLQGGDTQATKIEWALLQAQRGALASTEAFLRDAVAHDDLDAVEILDILADALVRDHRAPEAHACLDELLRRRPDDFDLLVRHARTAEDQGWYAVAAESLQKAVNQRPDARGVRLSLVQALASVGRYPDAMAQLAILREDEPDDPDVVFALARCLAWQGQKEQAAGLLDKLLARQPDNWAVLSERGGLCLDLDRPAEAEGFLRRAQSLAPPNQALLMRLADCLRLLDKQEEARGYREAGERLKADALLATQLGRRIREERPPDADRCCELARVYLRMGNEQDALFYFHKALEVNPEHRPTYEALVAYYERVGDREQSALHRQKLRDRE